MTLSATDGDTALDFADTLVRRLNLAAMLQDSSIEAAEKDYYGGLWDRYDALVGVANNSNTSNSSKWLINDAITSGKDMLGRQGTVLCLLFCSKQKNPEIH